jgi:hypothetical protein
MRPERAVTRYSYRTRTQRGQSLIPHAFEGQMFAYTVTNQATDFLTEVGLPFLTRGFAL